MSLDAEGLGEAIARHGAVVRVVVAETAGSTPREVGAAMLVRADGQTGTIGGGALEHEALATARTMLAGALPDRLDRLALGPARGQCCGGAVVLLSERWDGARLSALDGPVLARPLPGSAGPEMPLAVRRILSRARSEGVIPAPGIVRGWMVEPLCPPRRQIWIWGAGHVGRAIIAVLAPLPGLALSWIDTDRARFPEDIPAGVTIHATPALGGLVAGAPQDAEHLVLTFSHALDLELCHLLLGHGFGRLGLIGSATKRARFRSRLAVLGHGAGAIGRIECPIGAPELGKHPQAIAVGVAAAILGTKAAGSADHKASASTGGQ